MKIRLIAAALTLASVFGLFGCAFIGDSTQTAENKDPTFLSAAAGGITPVADEATSGEVLNLAATDENGELVVKGFYGNYDLEIETPNGIKTATFHLDKFYERPHFIKL